MKLVTVLILAILSPLVISVILSALVTTLPFSTNLPSWVSETQTYVKNGTSILYQNKMNTIVKYLDVSFSQVTNGINLLHSCALNKSIGINNTWLRTYSGVSTIDSKLPPKDYNGLYLASTVFKLGVLSYEDLLQQNYVNSTALLDVCFRAVYLSNDIFSRVYFGTENGLFRRFPYTRLDNYVYLSYTSSLTQLPMTGYDPRHRIWYTIAKDNTVKFTAPYLDASTKKMSISISRGIYTDSGGVPSTGTAELLGVVAADFYMEKIDSMLQGTYLIDSTGLVISQQGRNEETMIYTLEPAISASILSLILNYKGNDTMYSTFIKNGEMWHILYNNVQLGRYKVLLLYPESELTSNNLYNYVNTQIRNFNIVIGSIFGVLLCIFMFAIYKLAKKYTWSLKILIKVLDRISKGNLEKEKGNESPYSAELQGLIGEFRILVSVTKSSEELFASGDYNAALNSCKALLQTMIEREIPLGIGRCYNNIGTCHEKLGNTHEARINFVKAIDNIKDVLLKSPTLNDELKLTYTILHAERIMNMGVLESNAGDYRKAQEYFEESYRIHGECKNPLGMCKVIFNFTPVCAKLGNIARAIELTNEGESIAKLRHDPQLITYSVTNRAILEMYQRSYHTAREKFIQVLATPDVSYDIKHICATHLQQIYTLLNEVIPTDVRALLIHYCTITSTSPSGISKHVHFILDKSGSMSGSPIEMCRKSIRDIIDHSLRDDDFISISVFNDKVNQLVSRTIKRENVAFILDRLNGEKAEGGTQFYEALISGVKMTSHSEDKENWLVILTDGEDNCYSDLKINRVELINSVKDAVSMFNGTLIIMTKGTLKNLKEIEDICASARRAKHIRVDSSHDGIINAFGNVGKLITGKLNFERF